MLLGLILIIGFICYTLRLPVFVATFGSILVTPILGFLLGINHPLDYILYALSLGLAFGVILLLHPTKFALRQPKPILTEFEPLLVFSLFYAVLYHFNHSWPDFINMGERLRDYALLGSAVNFPLSAREPWMADTELNYYLYWYRFGHFISTLATLPLWEVYHQLQAFTFALFGTTAYFIFRTFFSLTWNGALGCSAVIALGSNVKGIVQFFKQDDYWWGPSRVVPGAINEFPAWSFLLGDNHPHFLNLGLEPFLFVCLVTILPIFAKPLDRLVFFCCFALISTGWTYYANAWEIPALGILLASGCAALVLLPKNGTDSIWRSLEEKGKLSLSVLWSSIRISQLRQVASWRSVAIIFISATLLTSIYVGSLNISPTHTPLRWVSGPILRTQLIDLLWHWGVPLCLIGLCQAFLFKTWKLRLASILLLIISIFFSLALPFLLVLLGLIVAGQLFFTDYSRSLISRVSITTFGLAGMLMIIFPEYLFFDDPYGGEIERMNTIFKFYSAAWFPIHCSALGMLAHVFQNYFSAPKFKSAVLSLQLCALIIMLGFFGRTTSLRESKATHIRPRSQGLSEVDKLFPGAGPTIQQLISLPPGTVLEAQGPAYNYTSHVSTLSGNEAFLGWANHVNLLSRDYAEVTRREKVTDEFYLVSDCQRKIEILKSEQISYAILGPMELKKYPSLNVGQFSCLKQLIQNGQYWVFALNG